jgi:hypothetical protein
VKDMEGKRKEKSKKKLKKKNVLERKQKGNK